MYTSLLGTMRESSPFMRSTTATALLAFLILTMQSTIAVAVEQISTTTAEAASAEKEYSKTLQRIEAKLTRLEEKFEQQLDGTLEHNEVKQLQQTLAQLDHTVSQGFHQIEQHITDKGLAEVIMQRHQTMVENYQTEYQALIEDLDAMDTASDDISRHQHAQAALNRLKAKKNKRNHQPFDPNQLPNSTLQPNSDNKPKETQDAFTQAGLFNTPYVQLAALGDFTFDKLIEADNPAYLADTVEVTLSQPIKDKAAELNHDPVKIYHWVRNNVEWLPSWGAIQDADLTLSSLRGNAMDIASLTIALLRASQIPARYVHGTIDVPADKYKNWTGDFSNINAAADYAASGGIPTTTVTTGGQISKIRLEHIWVEAAIDYQPSKGAINKDADSWVQMDPSFKQYDYETGLDTLAISEIDPETLAQSFLSSGTVNEQENWVTGFDPNILATVQTQAQQKLETYIQDNLTDPTVGDVIGGRKTIIKEFSVLPSSLPNTIKVTGTRYDKLPVSLQQTITYGFSKDILGEINDPLSFPWAQLNNKKVTLSFKPATEADEQALASLLPEGDITDISQLPGSIPSYLINVVPELKVEGQVVKTGGAMKLGEELDFVTGVQFAGRGQLQSPRTYQVIAGSYLSVNVIAGSVSSQKLGELQAKIEQTKQTLESADPTQIAALNREDLLGDMFYVGSLGYYAQLLTLSHVAGLASKGHYQLAAGTGTVGYEPRVDYFFGFPRSIEPGGVSLDIPLVNISAVNDGDAEKKKQFTRNAGVLSSALEHALPEQMFDPQDPAVEQPNAISAVKALQIANNTGQRIYHITQANMASTLPDINHDSDTLAEIRASLNAGKEVITHTDAVSVPGWVGAGYSIIDPETGDGAYKISGGVNGGFLELYDSNGGISTSLFLTSLLIPLVSSASLLLPLLGVILLIINIFHVIIKVLQTDLILKENGCPEAISTMLIWLSGALLALPRLIRTPIANVVMPFISFTVKNTIGSSAPLCKYHL